jgi:hypothetical protein
MIALSALIAIGFAMATLGIALMALGEVPFVAGKRISAVRSRLIGLTLLAFLPLVAGMRAIVNLVLPDTIDPQALTWSIFGFLWFVVVLILFRVMVPKREPRKPAKGTATSSSKNPFGEAAPAEEAKPKKGAGKTKSPEPAAESVAWMEEEPEPAPAKKPSAKKTPEPAKPASGKKSPKPVEDDNPFNFS